MPSASSTYSAAPLPVSTTSMRERSPKRTGTAHQRSSWLTVVVPMAAPTWPSILVRPSSNEKSCSSRREATSTRQPPLASVKYTWRPSCEGWTDHSTRPSCSVSCTSVPSSCSSTKISARPLRCETNTRCRMASSIAGR